MILYSVTINIDNSVHEEWLRWMKEEHIPDVLQTGLFVENRILRMLNEVDNGGTTYNFQYYLDNMHDYEIYQAVYADRLQAAHYERFKDKFVAFRTVLEVVE